MFLKSFERQHKQKRKQYETELNNRNMDCFAIIIVLHKHATTHSTLSVQRILQFLTLIIPDVDDKTRSFFTIADTSPTIILIDAIKFP